MQPKWDIRNWWVCQAIKWTCTATPQPQTQVESVPEQALKARVSHTEVAPTPTVPTSPPSWTVPVPRWAFLLISWQRKRRRGLAHRRVCQADTAPREEGGQPSLGHLQRPAVTGNPPSGQDSGQCTWPLTLLRHIITHSHWPVAQLEGQGLGRSMTGNPVTRRFGEEVCKQPTLNGKKMWTYLHPIKGRPQQRSLIVKWTDGLVLVSETPSASSLSHPAITQGAHQRVATVPGTEDTRSHSNADVYSPQLTRLLSPLPSASHWATPWVLPCNSLAPLTLIIFKKQRSKHI